MSSARDDILLRIRRAHSVTSAPSPIQREQSSPHVERTRILETFVQITEDYRAIVNRCTDDTLAEHIAASLVSSKASRVAVSAEMDTAWLTHFSGEILRDNRLTTAELDDVDAVVTGAAIAIAGTGTIVLDHSGNQGRRALTLIPDVHVCVVRADQVVPDVPTAVRRLRPAIDAHRALTWISGPSATSDIELSRIEGVHGPRTLHVLLVDDASEEVSAVHAAS
ncbi:LutC/YkgG family protein [Flexivirga oryzae]|uniref:L-lactate dehydrogenase complex protein LldG n=1 Tax=Flexivirga oryzae TaxID=1794944 RepID=A0A839N2S0_9MICO|nr:LUD domain-containing protein [Flexivirga oryzae]MBB2892018.1 L-lactate dehydrogenase complex protein LldG [Flexivirga oryzae]